MIAYNDKLDICLAIICLAFYKYFESKSDLVHGFLQRQERMDLIALSIMIRGVGNVLVMTTAYFFTQELTLALAISVVKSWAVYYYIDNRNYLRLYKDQNFVHKTVLDLFQIAWPLGIVVFANTLNLNIPRYFIAHYYGESFVGIFASISYFLVAGATLVNAIGQSAIPRLANLGIANMLAFKALSQKIFAVIVLIGLIGVLIAHYFGDWILHLVYNDVISNYHLLFMQIMWSGVAVYSSVAIGCSLTALRDFRLQGYFSIINIVIMLVTSFFLVSYYGLSGAAVAIGVTHLIKLFIAWLRMRYVYKYWKLDYV
ncbi:O-antigen/teichoic acid export membrane protein [Desulfomicrobium macestii]|uniref:O-antigen/teichoic acid export membrane protein n=2 Tax=Desulfomicrobium macestii TaxID=90731 RepID=A0ABR9H5H7_9BACT|nr:O-antigen/teichoic acid export membrane protein [Desulfomicrobium macestii]